jgi:hypothetical protein
MLLFLTHQHLLNSNLLPQGSYIVTSEHEAHSPASALFGNRTANISSTGNIKLSHIWNTLSHMKVCPLTDTRTVCYTSVAKQFDSWLSVLAERKHS